MSRRAGAAARRRSLMFLDQLRRLVGRARLRKRRLQRQQTGGGHQMGCGEMGRSGRASSPAVSALSSRVKATLIGLSF